MTMRRDPIYHRPTRASRPTSPRCSASRSARSSFRCCWKFPEITDFYLPPGGCNYRIRGRVDEEAVPGHAKRDVRVELPAPVHVHEMIVVDDDVDDARRWKEVVWALTTRVDPARDADRRVDADRLPRDFASPRVGPRGKLGIDATRSGPADDARLGAPIRDGRGLVRRVGCAADAGF
jgi:4-hydroxy-3-polyprenylbenzoate decarboxylase